MAKTQTFDTDTVGNVEMGDNLIEDGRVACVRNMNNRRIVHVIDPSGESRL